MKNCKKKESKQTIKEGRVKEEKTYNKLSNGGRLAKGLEEELENVRD